MGACDVESLPYNSLIVWTKKSHICSFVCQSTIFLPSPIHMLSTLVLVLGYNNNYIYWYIIRFRGFYYYNGGSGLGLSTTTNDLAPNTPIKLGLTLSLSIVYN